VQKPLDPSLLSRLYIRHATQADLPKLEWNGEYAHFRRLYAESYQSAQIGRAVLWVAELEESGLIGQLFVHLFNHRNRLADGLSRAYIYGFRVLPTYRSRGVGSRLLQVAEQDLVQRGFEKVALNVSQENRLARRMYEERGYHVVAADPGRWFYLDEKGQRVDVIEPAWRMEKLLSKSATLT
jgi:ribosomal protein S18 acetylase RimI-like enzyme